MKTLAVWRSTIVLLMFMAFSTAAAAETLQPEWEILRKEIDDLRKDNAEIRKTNSELVHKMQPLGDSTELVLNSRFGPNAPVVSRVGKLQMNGLVQVWYCSFQHDRNALFNSPQINGIQDTNETSDNDSFRIRRTELRFNFDLNEQITTEVMIDPAREAQSFPTLPDNQANSSIFKRLTNSNVANTQTGAGSAPRLLNNAWIDYHDFVPHHDFKVGQFKPPFGEEGIRKSSELDFVERSMLGQLADFRDMGVYAHGEWWDVNGKGFNDYNDGSGRFQYWIGAFDSAGNFQESAGQQQNRSDDNSNKDIVYRLLVRPVWKQPTWGSLEIGYSQQFGVHGEYGASDPIDSPEPGLNRSRTWANRMDAWGYYAPGAMLRGMWVRGEWEWQKDRNAPQSVIDILGNGNSGDGSTQTNGKPFVTQGFYVATGYRLGNSVFGGECSRLPAWAQNLEFAFRYETYQNVEIADLVRNDHTDVFKTSVYTGGLNYYVSGTTKIQVNYDGLRDPHVSKGDLQFHNVRNNVLIVNFQVTW